MRQRNCDKKRLNCRKDCRNEIWQRFKKTLDFKNIGRFSFYIFRIWNFLKMAEQLAAQVELMKAQMAAQKTMMRDANIRAEVGRHKSPQIKVDFLKILFSISYFTKWNYTSLIWIFFC